MGGGGCELQEGEGVGGEGWLVGGGGSGRRRSLATGVVEGGGGPYGPGLPGLGATLATGGHRRVGRG